MTQPIPAPRNIKTCSVLPKEPVAAPSNIAPPTEPNSKLPPSQPVPTLNDTVKVGNDNSVQDQKDRNVITQNIRKRALENTYKSASNMVLNYEKRKRVKVQDFNIGDTVSVFVPKIDRSSTDLLCVPGKVVKIHDIYIT